LERRRNAGRRGHVSKITVAENGLETWPRRPAFCHLSKPRSPPTMASKWTYRQANYGGRGAEIAHGLRNSCPKFRVCSLAAFWPPWGEVHWGRPCVVWGLTLIWRPSRPLPGCRSVGKCEVAPGGCIKDPKRQSPLLPLTLFLNTGNPVLEDVIVVVVECITQRERLDPA
jgi:hypothetical protein